MRVGLIGAGRIGEVHARSLSVGGVVDELVVHDPDGARATALAAETGARVVSSVGDLLGAVDAVVVAAPTSAHVELVETTIDAGLPVFCEKPVAPDLRELTRLADRADAAGCLVQVGFHYRFDPALRALADQTAGYPAPRLVRIHSTTEFAPSPDYLAGAGGLVMDKLIHEIDMVRWLTMSISWINLSMTSPPAPAR